MLDQVVLEVLLLVLARVLGQREDLRREEALDELVHVDGTVDETDNKLVVGETLRKVFLDLRVLDESLAVFRALTVGSLDDVANKVEDSLTVRGLGDLSDALSQRRSPVLHLLDFLDVEVEVEVFADGLTVEVFVLDGDLLHGLIPF